MLSGFPPHQDAPAFVQFGQSTHMTVMFTIDPTTAENGCLEVVPGSHKNDYDQGILPQEKHDGSISREWCNKEQWIPVYCKPVCIISFRWLRSVFVSNRGQSGFRFDLWSLFGTSIWRQQDRQFSCCNLPDLQCCSGR